MPQRDLRDGGPQAFKTSDWLIQLLCGSRRWLPLSGHLIGQLLVVPLLCFAKSLCCSTFYLCRVAVGSSQLPGRGHLDHR